MKIEKGDLLTLDQNEKYLVIDNILYDGIKYIFTNKFMNEEPTEEYAIYEVDEQNEDGELNLIEDQTKIEILLPMFNNNVQKLIQDVKNERFNIE